MRIIIEWNRCRGFDSKQLALQFPTMPRVFFRLLAALLLALTIPLQGMAAAMAGQCMAAGHHQGGSGQGDHKHEPAGADGHDQHSHSDAGDAEQGDDAKQSHCGPCTACCASASIAGPAGLSILTLPSKVAYVSLQLPPPGVQPDGFDRPPLAL
jgi:hypothetical protein